MRGERFAGPRAHRSAGWWRHPSGIRPENAVRGGLQVSLDRFAGSRGPLWPASFARPVPDIDPPLVLPLRVPSTAAQDPLVQRRFWMYGGTVVLSFIVVLIGF